MALYSNNLSKIIQFSLIFCCMLLVVAIPAYLINRYITDLIVERLGQDAKNVAIVTAKLIEEDAGSYHILANHLAPPKDPMGIEYYQRMLSIFQQLKHAVGADFIYTEKKISDAEIVYVLDAEDPAGDVFAPNGTRDELSSYELEAFTTKIPFYTEIISYSNWGDYLTGFAPIIDPATQDLLGIVGVDYSLGSVKQNTARIRLASNLAFFFIALLGSILVHFLMLSRYRTMKMDYLTGLYTKQYFDSQLKRLVRDAEYSKKPLSLIILDIDAFKQINDLQGHPQGDVALRVVAEVVKKNMRPSDIGCRFGGDEFAILLPGFSQEEAKDVADRLLQGVSQPDLALKGVDRMTLSIGVAQWESGMSAGQLVVCADQTMYKAKNTGKNRVMVYKNSFS